MIIKKFQGKSEAEAVESAKKELGNNVVIMNVRNVKRKGLFSFILPQLTEVTVALEEEPERVPVPKKEAAPAQMLPEPAVRRELTTLPPYEGGNRNNHDPERTRKLLLTKKEILKILGKIKQESYTIVPLELFLERGFAKLEIGLCKGKKLHDKRETLKKKDIQREMERYK